MSDYAKQIESLDISVFAAITSQTTDAEKRSLLGLQRAVARKYPAFTYLEIGSHLGGSIQPYVLDDRCKRVYSIDPRPAHQPDDRTEGYVAHYEDNSSARMLALLSDIGGGSTDTSKVTCIDSDASEIDPAAIESKPQLAFIDGEHTYKAVLSDFAFCEQVVDAAGIVAFHDLGIVFPGIVDICKKLRERGRTFIPLKLEGGVFAIVFDPALIEDDPYLAALHKQNKRFMSLFPIQRKLKKVLPGPMFRALRSMRNKMRKAPAQAAAPAKG